MYDILVYLFENCQHHELADQKDRVAKKLSAAGFDDSDISEALTWLTARSHRYPTRARRSAPTRPRSWPSSTPNAAAC
jgi:uncharacterized protein Smg (DUF494 family)